MKNLYKLQSIVLLSFLLIYLNGKSQVNFTIAATACAGSTQTLSLVSGTISVLSNTWATLPAGAVFSAANSTITTVIFPAAGIYTVAVAAITSNGLAYFTNTISVLSAPSLTLSQSSMTTCITNNFPMFSIQVALSASGANTYTWYAPESTSTPSNNPTIVVRPISDACYTVVGSISNCKTYSTMCISVIPQFTFAVNPSLAIRCLPDSLKLSIIQIGSPAYGPPSSYGYYWTESPGSSSITISSYFTPTVLVYPNGANTYTAEVKDSQACISIPKIINVSVQTCTGIHSNVSNTNGIKVFPNPVLEELFWDIESENIKIEYLTLTNALGEMILFINNPKAKDKIDLSFLSKGIYFMNFRSEEGEKLCKFIKE